MFSHSAHGPGGIGARAPAFAVLLLVPFGASAAPTGVFEATGDIAAEFENFRTALGGANNGNALGPIADGHRQINWDAGIVPFDMPGNFFNTTVPRGAEFGTDAGSEFRVSNPDLTDPTAPGGGDNEFSSINTTYPGQFQTFSDPRLFTPFGTNVLDVNFFVSGSNTPGTVNGFGAVFTDIDAPNSNVMQFFDANGNELLSEFVDDDPQGLSFFGATFAPGELFRVRITSGNTPIGPDDDPASGVDVVVIDDLIYGEPQEIAAGNVPEPTALALVSLGLAGMGIARRKKVS